MIATLNSPFRDTLAAVSPTLRVNFTGKGPARDATSHIEGLTRGEMGSGSTELK